MLFMVPLRAGECVGTPLSLGAYMHVTGSGMPQTPVSQV